MNEIRLTNLNNTIAYLTNIKENSYNNLDRVRARLSECISAKERIEEKQKLLLLKPKVKRSNRGYSDREIIQYSTKGRKLKTWNEVYDIKKHYIDKGIHFNTNEIIRCCKGDYKTRRGYIWKFKE